MARLIERSFDPNRPVKVRRFFVAAGRHWEPGRAFPWKNMAIAQRRVKLLFDAGKLMHSEDSDGAAAPEQEPQSQRIRLVEDTLKGSVPAVDLEPSQDLAADGETSEAEILTSTDELDTLTMPELREIADNEGAPTRVSRQAQREAIREHRLGQK